jgi:hypothetical protein
VHVLFDQGIPHPLRAALTAHNVSTAHERGWSKLRNGELLSTAEHDGCEVFVTTDTSLRHQHNLSGRCLGIFVLLTTSWPRFHQALPSIVSPGTRPHREAIQKLKSYTWTASTGLLAESVGFPRLCLRISQRFGVITPMLKLQKTSTAWTTSRHRLLTCSLVGPGVTNTLIVGTGTVDDQGVGTDVVPVADRGDDKDNH